MRDSCIRYLRPTKCPNSSGLNERDVDIEITAIEADTWFAVRCGVCSSLGKVAGAGFDAVRWDGWMAGWLGQSQVHQFQRMETRAVVLNGRAKILCSRME